MHAMCVCLSLCVHVWLLVSVAAGPMCELTSIL